MFKQSDPGQARIAVTGLGYAGLPIAMEPGNQLDTTGFDIAVHGAKALRIGAGHTRQTSSWELSYITCLITRLRFFPRIEDLANCSFCSVTVPAPIDHYQYFNLDSLLAAGKTVGVDQKPGDVPGTAASVEDLVREVGDKPEALIETGTTNFVTWYKGY